MKLTKTAKGILADLLGGKQPYKPGPDSIVWELVAEGYLTADDGEFELTPKGKEAAGEEAGVLAAQRARKNQASRARHSAATSVGLTRTRSGSYESQDPVGRGIGEVLDEVRIRKATKGNPRNLPCPTCGRPNMLTPADKAKGYQCDRCADRDEGGYGESIGDLAGDLRSLLDATSATTTKDAKKGARQVVGGEADLRNQKKSARKSARRDARQKVSAILRGTGDPDADLRPKSRVTGRDVS